MKVKKNVMGLKSYLLSIVLNMDLISMDNGMNGKEDEYGCNVKV